MADYIIELLQNKQLWQKLSKNGRQFVQQNFDWQEISQKLDMIYKAIGEKRSN
jgi:glycosyltransferase involved in cell wall biosynthesis